MSENAKTVKIGKRLSGKKRRTNYIIYAWRITMKLDLPLPNQVAFYLCTPFHALKLSVRREFVSSEPMSCRERSVVI